MKFFKKYRVLLIILLIATAGCVIWQLSIDKNNKKNEPTETASIETTEAMVDVRGEKYGTNTSRLDMTGKNIGKVSDFANEFSQLSQLSTIDLHNCEITNIDKAWLVDNYPDITFEWTSSIDGVDIESTADNADISTHVITDVEAFSEVLDTLPILRTLDMCDCGLTNEQMEELQTKYPEIKFVWKVTLGLWTIRTDTVAFSTLKDGSITYRLTNDDVKVLKYCTDMVALDLGHNKVTDISFLEYMPELKILILVDDRVLDDDSAGYISDLSELKYVPKLMYLEFFVGSVTDISFLQYLPNMVDLNISYNPISDVTPLLNLPKIERLYLEHTNLTEADYELLQTTYPDAQVVYYGEGSVDQGWREHDRYKAMIDMYHNNYVNELFED